MTYDEYFGRWEYSFIIPPNLEQINFVFNDGQNNWDNNNGNDWNVNVQNMLLGDVNFDNTLDVLDIILIVSFILNNNENHIGELRSGVYSPHFNKVIGIAMLKKPNWNTGTKIKININGKSVNGTVCDLPFI